MDLSTCKPDALRLREIAITLDRLKASSRNNLVKLTDCGSLLIDAVHAGVFYAVEYATLRHAVERSLTRKTSQPEDERLGRFALNVVEWCESEGHIPPLLTVATRDFPKGMNERLLALLDSVTNIVNNACQPNSSIVECARLTHDATPIDAFPPDDGWHFEPDRVWFRRKSYDGQHQPIAVLKTFVESRKTRLEYSDLHCAWDDHALTLTNENVCVAVSEARDIARQIARDINCDADTVKNPIPKKRNGGFEFILPKK